MTLRELWIRSVRAGRMMLRAVFIGGLILAGALGVSHAADDAEVGSGRRFQVSRENQVGTMLQPLRNILEVPEAEIDLAQAKLTIDRLIDPSVDIQATIKEVDRMAGQLRTRLPFGAGRRETAVAILSYLKDPGSWNDGRPFHYDLDDPFGKDLRNKLLPTYLATRKGNCVSMPTLFVILAQRVGLDATLATAPLHQFAKIRDDNGQTLNIEATSFGTLSDERYRHEYGVSDEALQNGVYLQPWLGRRENVAVMMDALMEFYGREREHALRIATAELALKAYPRSVNAMLHLASAHQTMLKERYVGRYASLTEMTDAQITDYKRLGEAMEYWGRQAETLGWREKTAENDAAYERSIQRAKAENGGTR